jgi:hypothetical protein
MCKDRGGEMITACPVCGKKMIGKVGAEQYYCWECCVEFSINGQEVQVFAVELDGTLTICETSVGSVVNS